MKSFIQIKYMLPFHPGRIVYISGIKRVKYHHCNHQCLCLSITSWCNVYQCLSITEYCKASGKILRKTADDYGFNFFFFFCQNEEKVCLIMSYFRRSSQFSVLVSSVSEALRQVSWMCFATDICYLKPKKNAKKIMNSTVSRTHKLVQQFLIFLCSHLAL